MSELKQLWCKLYRWWLHCCADREMKRAQKRVDELTKEDRNDGWW